MKLKLSGHSVYKTEYHIVFCTKYRRRILNLGVENYLKKAFPKIVRQMPGVEINSLGFDSTMRDHVHFEMCIPPKYSISDVVGKLKCQSASLLREAFVWLEKVYWRENIVWSEGFFVSSVGVNEEVIKRYVEWQGRQDSGQGQLNLLDSASL